MDCHSYHGLVDKASPEEAVVLGGLIPGCGFKFFKPSDITGLIRLNLGNAMPVVGATAPQGADLPWKHVWVVSECSMLSHVNGFSAGH